MSGRQITLEDVATEAGVSVQTVSRTLNNPDIVSERTRLKVMGAMNRLNYVPNRSAQSLAGKTLPTLGIVTTSLALHAPSQIVTSIKNTAEKNGYLVAITMLRKWNIQVLQSSLNEFRAQKTSNLIMCLPLEKYDAEKLVADNPDMLCVFLDVPPSAEVCHVGFMHSDGTASSVQHLLDLGHKNFGLLSGPESSISARLRLACWRDALYRSGIAEMDTEYGDWSARSGWLKTLEMFSRTPEITAILVASDQMALGVISALRQLNRNVPEDVSIIGYDDTPDSQYFYPKLTTVKQNFDELGKKAFFYLIQMLKNHEAISAKELLPTKLVIRESTASPKNESCNNSLIRELKVLIGRL